MVARKHVKLKLAILVPRAAPGSLPDVIYRRNQIPARVDREHRCTWRSPGNLVAPPVEAIRDRAVCAFDVEFSSAPLTKSAVSAHFHAR